MEYNCSVITAIYWLEASDRNKRILIYEHWELQIVGVILEAAFMPQTARRSSPFWAP